jgi:hypothetical protein
VFNQEFRTTKFNSIHKKNQYFFQPPDLLIRQTLPNPILPKRKRQKKMNARPKRLRKTGST